MAPAKATRNVSPRTTTTSTAGARRSAPATKATKVVKLNVQPAQLSRFASTAPSKASSPTHSSTPTIQVTDESSEVKPAAGSEATPTPAPEATPDASMLDVPAATATAAKGRGRGKATAGPKTGTGRVTAPRAPRVRARPGPRRRNKL